MLIIPECQAAHIPRECAASIMRRAVLARKSWGSQKPSGLARKWLKPVREALLWSKQLAALSMQRMRPGMFATWHSGIMSTTKDPRMTNSQIVKKVCQHPDPERVIELFADEKE